MERVSQAKDASHNYDVDPKTIVDESELNEPYEFDKEPENPEDAPGGGIGGEILIGLGVLFVIIVIVFAVKFHKRNQLGAVQFAKLTEREKKDDGEKLVE